MINTKTPRLEGTKGVESLGFVIARKCKKMNKNNPLTPFFKGE
jgi:hypothetical protein